MAQDFIRYDLHVQEALRGVVRRILADVARDGLPGDHHFYITFLTRHPGVKLSDRMRAEYPEEMTIVLQHQFWDLTVTETGFEVGLSFRGIPEKLAVPFEAMTGFFDRSVDFGLRFETDSETLEDEELEEGLDEAAFDDAPSGQVTQGAFPRRVFEIAEPDAEKAGRGGREDAPGEAAASPSQETGGETPGPEKAAGTDDAGGNGSDGGGQAGAEVVRLDAFRKKNT